MRLPLNWPIYLLGGFIFYQFFYLGYKEYNLRQLARLKQHEQLEAKSRKIQETRTPAGILLDLYLPSRRQTIRKTLGNPIYQVEQVTDDTYSVIFLTKEKRGDGEFITRNYAFELNMATRDILPKNEAAQRLIAEGPLDDERRKQQELRKAAQQTPPGRGET